MAAGPLPGSLLLRETFSVFRLDAFNLSGTTNSLALLKGRADITSARFDCIVGASRSRSETIDIVISSAFSHLVCTPLQSVHFLLHRCSRLNEIHILTYIQY